MKRAGKALLRVAGLALAITLAVFLVRWGWGWFSGNMLFGFVFEGSTAAMGSITNNASLIRKMKTEMPGSVTDDTEAEEENT